MPRAKMPRAATLQAQISASHPTRRVVSPRPVPVPVDEVSIQWYPWPTLTFPRKT